MMTTTDTLERVRTRIRSIESLPALPVVLRPLVQTLDRPVEQVDVDRVVELVSYDKTIAAQCVRMANSALFARSKEVESVRAAVVNLGMWRIRDLVFSRCLTQVFSLKRWIVDATVFWRHSLGCAMVSRKFAELIHYSDVEKAYLAGLLHDIGVLVNSIVAPDDFQRAFETAVRDRIPLDEAEQAVMGFTHSDSGQILAEHWKMTPEIVETIAHHHDLGDPERSSPLVSLVHLSDLFCRVRGLGYDYYESRQVEFAHEPGWLHLAAKFPGMANLDVERFTFELDEYAREVGGVVEAVFSNQS